ncbi:MAG: AAA family ATPase [Bacteroidales bacterium]|nr:AAA family ATPase [Bacteroidales bacterium]
MIYLDAFHIPSADEEHRFFMQYCGLNCYSSFYPFQVFPAKEISRFTFSEVTIFAGGNGSGKSTLLNIITEKLGIARTALFNKTDFHSLYMPLCNAYMAIFDKTDIRDLMSVSKFITSDDVFSHLLEVRKRNDNLDFKRSIWVENRRNYMMNPDQRPREIDMDDPKSIRRYRESSEQMNIRRTFSQTLIKNIGTNERTFSNGETAIKYFADNIQPGGLYILDEPENSLSSEYQIDLASFIESMARFHNCQFIISSHSPFFLSIRGAMVYDLDSVPATVKKWTDIPNMRLLHDFFARRDAEFSKAP